MGREDPQLKLRLTEDMKNTVTEAAKANGRSVNAEIVARLEASFRAPLPELSGEGFWALIARMEAVVEASETLFMRQRDAVKELEQQVAHKPSKE